MKQLIFIFFAILPGFVTTAQNILTIAGNGTAGYIGDSGNPTSLEFSGPVGVTTDQQGDVYISDRNNHRVRMLSAYGHMVLLAGTGTAGFNGDGATSILAELNLPSATAVDSIGNILISDAGNNRIRSVDSNGAITTVAGNGTPGFAGDGGLATAASLNNPTGVAINAAGDIFIADAMNNRIRKVTKSTGFIQTIAGTGTAGFSGDGGLATLAELQNPSALAVDSSGAIYIVDQGNQRIRKISPSGIITTIAGTGVAGFNGDGISAITAQLNNPASVTFDRHRNLFIADYSNQRIRKIDTSGFITTVVGTGTAGFSGDGGPAISAQLNGPAGVTVDGFENLYIADQINNRIRKVCLQPLSITISGIQTICKGLSTLLTATTSPVKYYSYVWSTGGVYDTLHISPVITGQYSVTANGTGFLYGCSATQSVTITVLPTPTMTINSLKDTICLGDSLKLKADSAASYHWSSNAGGATTQTVMVHPAANATYTVTGTGSNGCKDSIAKTIHVMQCTTGISMVENEKQVKAYPNPTDGIFHIKTPLTEEPLVIYNAFGIALYSVKLTREESEIDLGDYPPGMYLLKIGSRKGRILKQ